MTSEQRHEPEPTTDDDERASGQREGTGGSTSGSDADQSKGDSPKVIVTGPGGLGIAESEDEDGEKRSDPTSVVEEPAKVMRLGSMIKQLLEEVRSAPLDEAARERLARIHEQSLEELESGLSPELVEELRRIALPFNEDASPSDAELRIAQAQLVGWLEGLFHGIQTALVAQQMAAQSQLAQMRRGLPPGQSGQPTGQMPPGLVLRGRDDSDSPGPGQYL